MKEDIQKYIYNTKIETFRPCKDPGRCKNPGKYYKD